MDILTGLFLCLGTLLILSASLGVLRMPDLYTRMHAATKAGTVGLSCVLLAVAISIPEISMISRVVGTMVFILLTAPVASHLLGRAMREVGYRIWRND